MTIASVIVSLSLMLLILGISATVTEYREYQKMKRRKSKDGKKVLKPSNSIDDGSYNSIIFYSDKMEVENKPNTARHKTNVNYGNLVFD